MEFTRELREVAHSLRRGPQFTILCASVLGLGIGLSTTMFAALNAVLLRPLPVLDQDRIVVLWRQGSERRGHIPMQVGDARRYAEQSRALSRVAFVERYYSQPLFMHDGDKYFLGNGDLVSGNFFQTMGIVPVVGRLFEPNDDLRGAEPVIVLSQSFWQRHYGGATDVIGRSLQVHGDSTRHRIIGVVPHGFNYPANTELWLPLVPNSINDGADTSSAIVDVVGRLAPGATLDAAQRELTAFAQQPSQPERFRRTSGVVTSFPDLVLGRVRGAFGVLSAGAVILLAIACVNVAALLLMRGVQTWREIAVRTAIGARTAHIVRRQITEGLVLAALGTAVGLALARGAVVLTRAVAPEDLPRFDSIHLDGAAAAAAVAIALLTALLFSIGPALVAARIDPAHVLRAGARSLSSTRSSRRAREILVMAQVAAAVVVLAGAGLIVRSLVELQRAELGFDKERVLIVELGWDFERLNTAEGSRLFFDAMLPRMRAIRGVEAASPILLAPFPPVGWGTNYHATDRPAQEQSNNAPLNIELVGHEYFDVFRLRPRVGRTLLESDRAGAASVVVVSESAARSLWPNGDALGKQLVPSHDATAPSTVVGIVADTRYHNYRNPRPTVYFAQHQPPAVPFEMVATMVAVRVTSGDPLALVPQIEAAVRETNMGVLVDKVMTLEQHLERPLAQPRFNALLLTAFALAAALIVATGLYAVLAFAVRTRLRELAIRAAIGAAPAALRSVVLRSAAVVVGSGILLGLVLVLVGTRALQSLLYNVSPNDPTSIALGVVALAVLVLLASLGPARIAARVSTAELLRDS